MWPAICWFWSIGFSAVQNQCTHLSGYFRALLHSTVKLCGDDNFITQPQPRLSTCPPWQRYQKLLQSFGQALSLIGQQTSLTWRIYGGLSKSRWETPEPPEMTWRPTWKQPGNPGHLSRPRGWSATCHIGLMQQLMQKELQANNDNIKMNLLFRHLICMCNISILCILFNIWIWEIKCLSFFGRQEHHSDSKTRL